jgi:hypothetical protein
MIEHDKELVLQNGSKIIFRGGWAKDTKYNSLLHSFAGSYTWFDNYTFFNAEDAWSWFDNTREQAIRDAVVINLGIVPQDEVYLTIKRLVGPKQSTLITADLSQLELRMLAYYYGMSSKRLWKKYGQDFSGFSGSFTGRFSSGRDSNFYDGVKYMDSDANGLRRGRFEGVRSVTGRFPSQDPAQSSPVRAYQSKLRKLPPFG